MKPNEISDVAVLTQAIIVLSYAIRVRSRAVSSPSRDPRRPGLVGVHAFPGLPFLSLSSWPRISETRPSLLFLESEGGAFAGRSLFLLFRLLD